MPPESISKIVSYIVSFHNVFDLPTFGIDVLPRQLMQGSVAVYSHSLGIIVNAFKRPAREAIHHCLWQGYTWIVIANSFVSFFRFAFNTLFRAART